MKYLKRSALILALALTVAAFAACGSATISRPTPSEGAQTVEIGGDVRAEIRSGELYVSCSTDALDNTVLKVSVDSYTGDELASVVYYKTCPNFYASFPIEESWGTGPVFASLVIESKANGDQPKEVYEQYGNRFENLTGENVLWNANGNVVVIQTGPIALEK